MMRFYYMNEKDKQIIENIIDFCNRINEYVSYYGNLKEEYLQNQLLQDACSLIIIQLGEQVNKLSNEFKEDHKDIPWNEIIGMRIVHTHHYEKVIDEIVWETIQNDVPHLKRYLEKILK